MLHIVVGDWYDCWWLQIYLWQIAKQHSLQLVTRFIETISIVSNDLGCNLLGHCDTLWYHCRVLSIFIVGQVVAIIIRIHFVDGDCKIPSLATVNDGYNQLVPVRPFSWFAHLSSAIITIYRFAIIDLYGSLFSRQYWSSLTIIIHASPLLATVTHHEPLLSMAKSG